MQDPGGVGELDRGGWAFQFDRGAAGDKFKLDEVLTAGALLLGRVTYEEFASAWPSRTGEFATKMNNIPKYVVSTTLQKASWNNSNLIKSNVTEEVTKMKTMPGGDILVAGSGQLVHSLMQNDLVDEYRLMIFPVFLGSGKRLVKDGSDKLALTLEKAVPVGNGVLILIYHPEREQ